MVDGKDYTKEELTKMKLSEIKTLELFSNIKPSGLNKEEIIESMIEFQNSTKPEFAAADVNKDGIVDAKDVAAVAKAMVDVEEIKTPIVEVESDKKETEDTEQEDEKEEEDVEVQKGPTFHRPIRKRNPMRF